MLALDRVPAPVSPLPRRFLYLGERLAIRPGGVARLGSEGDARLAEARLDGSRVTVSLDSGALPVPLPEALDSGAVEYTPGGAGLEVIGASAVSMPLGWAPRGGVLVVRDPAAAASVAAARGAEGRLGRLAVSVLVAREGFEAVLPLAACPAGVVSAKGGGGPPGVREAFYAAAVRPVPVRISGGVVAVGRPGAPLIDAAGLDLLQRLRWPPSFHCVPIEEGIEERVLRAAEPRLGGARCVRLECCGARLVLRSYRIRGLAVLKLCAPDAFVVASRVFHLSWETPRSLHAFARWLRDVRLAAERVAALAAGGAGAGAAGGR